MKKIVLLSALFFMFSTFSFAGGFEKRWFWFYSDNDEQYHVVITYDPQDEKNCSITDSNGAILLYTHNPFDGILIGNIGHWPNLFSFAGEASKGDINPDFLLTIPAHDPLLQHIIEQPTSFKVRSSGKYSKSENYHKVVFEAENKATIVIYLEKIEENEYRVSALFLKSEKGEKYSYRDFNFRRDFGNDGNDGGANMVVNYLHYQPDTRYRKYLEYELIDNLINARKRLITSLELISQTFIYTYILKLA